MKDTSIRSKIVTDWDELKHIVQRNKQEKKRIVFTNGCFDLLHRGHVEYLHDAKQLGDVLIVGVNSDESVKHNKGNQRPIVSLDDRMSVLAGLASVDLVTSFNEPKAIEIIKVIEPDIHVKGGDYDPESISEAPTVKALGGKVTVIPFIDGRSTSSIIQKIITTYATS